MTQIAAIAQSLLRGKKLSIMNGFQLFSCTNLPREISRSIEQKFDVEVHRESKDFTSEYGHKGVYFKYKLYYTDRNRDGINKMYKYIKEQKNK
jgi:hypothetical protein